MRNTLLIPMSGLVLLSACNTAKKPSDANFRAAINQYLTKHGPACSLIGQQFPIDVPRSQQNDSTGIGAKLAALERVSLVRATDTTAVVHGILDALRGPTPAQPVRRYELTTAGQKYFRQAPAALGETNSFCYGQESVDSIVKWTLPEAASHQAEVTYTYKIGDMAAWAALPDVQQAFPDIRTTVNGISQTNQIVGLQLTDRGWEVP
jgi:hypothetical protein